MAVDAPPSVREAAAELRFLRQYCVNVVVSRVGLSPANWFYVYDPDIPISRVSFPFSLSGEANGRTAIQAEIFVPGDARPDEEMLREQAVDDLARLLKFGRTEVVAAEIRCYPFSYVVSDLNRAAAVGVVREWLRSRGIETAGLYGNWAYIWSDRAFESGWALAQQMGCCP